MSFTLRSDVSRWATYRELSAQPSIWRAWSRQLGQLAGQIHDWVNHRQPDEIWFSGAGTSAFIGDTLVSHLNRQPGPARFRSIASTDLVGCPQNYIRPGVRPLVVSFGRSGNSPETIGTLDLLDSHFPQADRLHITCDAEGELAKRELAGDGQQFTIMLPPETNDSGFAMTSSFTTMLLTALACFDAAKPEPAEQLLASLADAAEALLAALPSIMGESNFHAPSRAVFLGSGPLIGAARESALKVLELSAGRIPTLWDTSLGFRHGPKAFVQPGTRVHVFISGDPHTRRYDLDIAQEIREQFGPSTVMTLGDGQSESDLCLPTVGNDAWSSVLHVLVAQFLAVHWSNELGMHVDNPFGNGNLTRVVRGVTLYPWP
jgi:tagatose-6-phosphate ketose/aldose isomerase